MCWNRKKAFSFERPAREEEKYKKKKKRKGTNEEVFLYASS